MLDVWTEKRVTTLKIMWLGGSSAAAIARELGDGVTRSAVLGKVDRLKLPKRNMDAVRAQRATAKRGRAGNPGQPKASSIVHRAEGRKQNGGGRAFKIAQAKKDGLSGKEAIDAVLTKPEVEMKTIVDDQPVISLMELTSDTCRWPTGTPGEAGFGFCGCQPLEGNPYCRMHHERGTQRVRNAA